MSGFFADVLQCNTQKRTDISLLYPPKRMAEIAEIMLIIHRIKGFNVQHITHYAAFRGLVANILYFTASSAPSGKAAPAR